MDTIAVQRPALSVGLAVTHQQFTVCCPLLIMAMFACYIRWAICYELGLNTSHVLNKRFLLNNMTTGHLGQGQNQRRCPKQKVRFHRLTQLLPCCFFPPALPSSATPGKAPPAKSLQGHESESQAGDDWQLDGTASSGPWWPNEIEFPLGIFLCELIQLLQYIGQIV